MPELQPSVAMIRTLGRDLSLRIPLLQLAGLPVAFQCARSDA